MSSGDELAVTETASPSGRAREERPEKQIGRYRLLRELGAGGMGVVYAAFDPELERNVALKVVLPGVSTDAKQRLLREARAMARLAHPNVVTVYEVGSADGRDYIAMELIDGTNLVEWLATSPGPLAVLDAFIAAGNGLATAHEAAIVHRDFKPHNVLRSGRGRVMVTDFGLAREAAVEPAASRDTQPLSGITQTGAVLGTPAYMAPEQWQGGEVTPATDQFAFCVALVEALAGARPFRGDSVEELRDAVLKGPDRVDLSRVPRRLRAPLRRGMAIEPAQRWPSMHALIVNLHRRSPVLWLALAGLAVVATVITALAMRHPTQIVTAAAPSCEPPSLAPEKVWNAGADAAIRAGQPAAADRLAATFRRWTDVRANVCGQPAGQRMSRLACLDKVLLRIDAVKRARLLDPKMDVWGVFAQLFEPDVCMLPDPPRMPASYTDAAIAGLALRSGFGQDPKLMDQVRAAPQSDTCAHAYLLWLEQTPHHFEEAKSLAQLCGDEQAYASAAMNLVVGKLTPFLDPALPAQLDEVAHLVDHAAQPFLTRQFHSFRGDVAQNQGDLDGALMFYRRADGGPPAAFEIERRLKIISVLLARSGPGDLAAVDRETASIRELWLPAYGPMQRLDIITGTTAWLRGDLATGHAALVKAYAELQAAPTEGTPVRGKVVDAHGAPVAGASVVVGNNLASDAVGPAIFLYNVVHDARDPVQFATTDAGGAFAFAHAAPGSEVIAQRGDERSLARPAGGNVVATLAPTRVLRGTLHTERRPGTTWVEASLPDQQAGWIAPVLDDGSYELAGLPPGKVELHAVRNRDTLYVRGPLADGDASFWPARTLDIVVRGVANDGGVVWVYPGRIHADTVGQLDPKESRPFVRDVARSLVEHGDAVAHLVDAPPGAVTACAVGVHLDHSDPGFVDKYYAHLKKQPVRCVAVDGAATRVVIETPPMARVE